MEVQAQHRRYSLVSSPLLVIFLRTGIQKYHRLHRYNLKGIKESFDEGLTIHKKTS